MLVKAWDARWPADYQSWVWLLHWECDTRDRSHRGLWHEQSREDRDLFVNIHWEHIQDGMAAQFNQHITDGDDLGVYDYGSIMHYPRNAFSRDGQDTITPTDPNAQIGQRNGLSAGDLAGVRALYRSGPGLGPNEDWTHGAYYGTRGTFFADVTGDGRPTPSSSTTTP